MLFIKNVGNSFKIKGKNTRQNQARPKAVAKVLRLVKFLQAAFEISVKNWTLPVDTGRTAGARRFFPNVN